MTDSRAAGADADEVFDGVPRHPLSERFTCPKWDESGQCICGAVLPPQREWIEAGHQWQRVECPSCGRGYVDEDDYIAIYDEGLTHDDE